MSYVQGFVVAVPAENKDAYRQHAAKAWPMFQEFGATRMVECWGDDVPDGKVTDFRRAVKAEAGELEPVLERIVAGEFTIDERMILEGRIQRGGGTDTTERHLALNDIVIARGALARVCRLDVSIDGTHLATFIADGLVVASPTGSTGYSFSAGGPILDPVSRNLVVTPIAAYLSAIRSVVVSPLQVVRCRVVDANEALVSIDGRVDLPIAVGDVVEVHAVERPIRLIEPKGAQPFWDLLRHKVELLPS